MYFLKNMYNMCVQINKGEIQYMLKNILLKEYENVFNDIMKEYNNIVNKNNGYYNYFKIIKYEIKVITSAFKTLINQKKNTFQSIFEDDSESILHAIDNVLFEHIKTIFESVYLFLNANK